MGAWSVSITGNDTAQDMKAEYSVAFSRHAPQEAVRLLDEYMGRFKPDFDENDGDWVDYRYSLADWMWRKGILYEALRDEVIGMIDRGLALDLYDDAKTLRKREKVLTDFREKLLSPQPASKPIRLSGVQPKPLYQAGDVIALQLITANAPEEADHLTRKFAYVRREYQALHGQWIALRKVGDEVSWQSAVDPSVADLWPCWQMYRAVFPALPTMADLAGVPFAGTLHTQDMHVRQQNETLFSSNNTMTWYRKRGATVIGQDLTGLEQPQADLAIVNSRVRSCGIINCIFLDVVRPDMQDDLEFFGMLKGVPATPPKSAGKSFLEDMRRRLEEMLAPRKKM